jgi:hypothetical protein
MTRLGEFWANFRPMGICMFTLDIFLKLQKYPHCWATFTTVKVMLNFDKNGLGYNVDDFLTNLSGHPASQSLLRQKITCLKNFSVKRQLCRSTEASRGRPGINRRRVEAARSPNMLKPSPWNNYYNACPARGQFLISPLGEKFDPPQKWSYPHFFVSPVALT